MMPSCLRFSRPAAPSLTTDAFLISLYLSSCLSAFQASVLSVCLFCLSSSLLSVAALSICLFMCLSVCVSVCVFVQKQLVWLNAAWCDQTSMRCLRAVQGTALPGLARRKLPLLRQPCLAPMSCQSPGFPSCPPFLPPVSSQSTETPPHRLPPPTLQ